MGKVESSMKIVNGNLISENLNFGITLYEMNSGIGRAESDLIDIMVNSSSRYSNANCSPFPSLAIQDKRASILEIFDTISESAYFWNCRMQKLLISGIGQLHFSAEIKSEISEEFEMLDLWVLLLGIGSVLVFNHTNLFAMESFQNESGQEDINDYSPLWKFVTKVEKAVGGGNVTWSCNICTKVCKGSYLRVKAHLLKQKGAGIAGCTAVTMDQMKCMQQLVDDAELRKKNSKPKEVSLPSSSASSNMALKPSFSGPGSLQNDDPTLTKKRKGQLGPLEKAFNLNARDELHSEIARLFYTGGLSFNIARNPHYVYAFSLATQRTIPGYLPPGYNLLRTSLLQKEKAHIEKLLEPTKTAWKQKGAINCEGQYKDKIFISKLLINDINEVGHQNIVQVVTDNASVCKAAGLLVEAKYPHIFWTPCVVHTLNLALKNICAPIDSLQNKEAFDKCKWIAEVANDASMIKNFILNHKMRLSMFNDNSNLKMLSLADTRFASSIIMLKRFRQIKKCLENMVISERMCTRRMM
ncbi:hypothetical protein ZIOFF_044169 [Zingiber officinale]|uniref:DUF659 domain-containing protein n=1 Tax=Zingiber officinale TaxID=94328 RepID=A0A8J5FW99_ZINOF|nr:hypothetical protein ZIOFF_044169 [Zingiber officinale]